MLRSSWGHLSRSALLDTLSRLASRRAKNIGGRNRVRRQQSGLRSATAEVLEARQLLSSPVAVDDSYNVVHDHALSPSSGTGVLNNDYEGGGGSGGSGGGGSLTA